MIVWWNNLSLAAQIFSCIAIPATLILLIQTIMMFIGIGGQAEGFADDSLDALDGTSGTDIDADGVFGDGDVETDTDASGFDGLRFLSFRGVIAFCVIFGWIGVSMDQSGAALWLTLLIASLGGLATMVGIAFLMRAVMRLHSDGNTDNRNAVGVSGRVHLTIPAQRGGEGKVHLMLQGAYVERDAVTDDVEAIPTGSEIVVVGTSGETTLIVKRK